VVSKDSSTQAIPFFLKSAAGEIFLIYFPPKSVRKEKKDVIFIPPFADEMNKSRRSAAILARDLAEVGVGTLLLDLYGTGDSEGDFVEARWDIWRADVQYAMKWLKQQGNELISLIGLRMGALLASDCVATLDTEISEIVLWQPITNGTSMMTQYLRIRTTADWMDNSPKKETVQDLRNRFKNGHAVEIAGYELSPELFSSLDSMKLSLSPEIAGVSLHWFELAYGSNLTLLPASERLVNEWREKGVNITTRTIEGDPFWAGQNITVVPELLSITTTTVKGRL
jgi:exosortase A-associated hydrolase 2